MTGRGAGRWVDRALIALVLILAAVTVAWVVFGTGTVPGFDR